MIPIGLATSLLLTANPLGKPDWQRLAAGVEYATLRMEASPQHGDGLLHVVRVSPSEAELRVYAKSQLGGESRTAAAWCQSERLVAVINAGMFETDFSTHTGYLRIGGHVNNGTWWKNYQSMLLIGSKKAGLPSAMIHDLRVTEDRKVQNYYDTASQNLRLIRGAGRSVWKENGRRWSEAAVAQDKEGRILLLFSRTPFSMASFNQKLLGLPLGIVRAMHVEGGPEASLSIRSPKVNLDLAGSYETGFNENDTNSAQWPLPNVIGIAARPRK